MKIIYSDNLNRLLTKISGLALAVVGLYTLVWAGWLTWHEITTWSKNLASIFFGSRAGEAISLGIGMKVIHYLLMGMLFLAVSVVLLKGYLGKIIYAISRRLYLTISVSFLLLSLHFNFLFLSIKAGEIFGSEPFMIEMSVSNLLAFISLSAAVIMLAWKNFHFQAGNTLIVALLSTLVFFTVYTPLHAFIGYTYTLLIISATLFTITGILAPLIPKRTREAVPHSGAEKAFHSNMRREAIPHAGGKGSGNLLILVPIVTFLVLVEELLLNSTHAGLGLALALVAMLSLPLSGAVLGKGDVRMQRFLEISGLVFANRVVLSPFPISFLVSPALLPAIYTLVLIACILYITYRKLDLSYVRLVKGETLLSQISAGLLTGYLLGFIEYFVLKPTPITQMNLTQTLVYLVIVMMVFVGITEELLFRGLLQRSLEDMVPLWQAIGISSLIFALMHIGWLNPVEIIFAYAAGIVFGLMYYKTKSLIAPIIAHGFGNLVLYILVLFF